MGTQKDQNVCFCFVGHLNKCVPQEPKLLEAPQAVRQFLIWIRKVFSDHVLEGPLSLYIQRGRLLGGGKDLQQHMMFRSGGLNNEI